MMTGLADKHFKDIYGCPVVEDGIACTAVKCDHMKDPPNSLSSDFRKLGERKCSTSTPTSLSNTADSICVTASINDSAFNESLVVSTFAEVCTISTMPSCKSSISHIPSSCHSNVCLPLPKVNLSAEFMDCSYELEEDSGVLSDWSSTISSVVEQVSPGCCSDGCSHSLEVPPFTCTPASISSKKLHRAFSSTPYSDQTEHIARIMKFFSPIEPDRLIGRKMGLTTVDIIGELAMRNLVEPLQLIARYLEPEDVCRMCAVNRQWQTTCDNQYPFRAKKGIKFTEDRDAWMSLEKENHPRSKMHVKATTGGFSPLQPVQEIVCQNSPKFFPANFNTPLPSLTRQILFNSFREEAAKLKNDECLRKCPRCMKPARVDQTQERAWCSSTDCVFDFCIRCNNKFHGSKQCSPVAAKKCRTDGTVSSKKSKKNLRRL